MGLTAVLKDKGRILGETTSTIRVEGTKIRTQTTGPVFKCRLEMPKEEEQTQDGRHRRMVRPKVIVGRKVKLAGDQQIEIQSKPVHGSADWLRYSIDGDAEPYRKRNTVLGWEAYVVRVK